MVVLQLVAMRRSLFLVLCSLFFVLLALTSLLLECEEETTKN